MALLLALSALTVGADDSISLLQCTHGTHRRQPAQRWDLENAMLDSPPGAYYDAVGPALAATSLAYNHTLPPPFVTSDVATNTTLPADLTGHAVWEFRDDLELNPEHSGVHAIVLASRAAKRAIIGFRGSCQSDLLDQCRADLCYLVRHHTFGSATPIFQGTEEQHSCSSFSSEQLAYIAQADAFVTRVQAALPGFALLLTGHSMGAHLAMATAAQLHLQALAFSPSPFHTALANDAKFSEKQIATLPAKDLVTIGDPWDLGINTALVPNARAGTTTCLLLSGTEPIECEEAGQRLLARETPDMASIMRCKGRTHDLGRYAELLRARKPDQKAPVYLPVCSTDFSTLKGAVGHFRRQG